ncbi:NUDIX hydrolase [Glycomyces luteolus]|uniref:NUDIX hydrolase n=1 Tax=Glycomyces luteolus TaxID=2670330 RepID=A0A9X3T4B3_9ACTN|nr:NUDIX hydrolase [Glycomyces luteolus]MDA1360850.1 NUDIX hydrolase [Glycomyces luteolus]
MSPDASPHEWLDRLPKHLAAAGALFTDTAGRVLVVKPNYRDHWLFVGGQLEEGETPEQACRREVKEEIGVDVELGDLLLVDWTQATEDRPFPLLVFIFDGGTIDADRIRLDDEELGEFRFLPTDEALRLLSANGRRRLPIALEAKRTGVTRYLSPGR